MSQTPPAGDPASYMSPEDSAALGDPSKNWAGLTGIIVSLAGLIPCICCWPLTVLTSICGIVFGVIGLKSQRRGMAMTGIIVGGVLLLLIVVLFVVMIVTDNFGQGWQDGLQQNPWQNLPTQPQPTPQTP